MIKKLAVLILSTFILTACGGKPAPVEETKTEVQEDAASEDAASEDTASDNATSETADEGTDLSDAQSTVTDVEGNGSFFLRLDDKVYFIRYAPDHIYESVLFADFYQTPHTGYHDYEPSKRTDDNALMCYDTATGKTTLLARGNLYAPLHYHDGKIFATQYEMTFDGDTVSERRELIWYYDLRTDKATTFGEGELYGIAEDGALISGELYTKETENGPYTTKSLTLRGYREGDGRDFGYGDDFTGDCFLLKDGFLFCNTTDAGDLEARYVRYADGAPVNLGTFPRYSPEDLDFNGYDRVVDALILNDTIYILREVRAGTGHFLQEYRVFSADIQMKGSLLDVTYMIPDGADEGTDTVALFVNEKGEVAVAGKKPGSAVSYTGELYYWDEKGDRLTLFEDLYEDPYTLPALTYADERMEIIEKRGDAFYGILHTTVLDKEESVGWRDAYTCLRTRMVRIDDKSGEMTVVEDVDYPENRTFKAYVWLRTDRNDVPKRPSSVYFAPLIKLTAENEFMMGRYDLTEDMLVNGFYPVFPGNDYGGTLYEAPLSDAFRFIADAGYQETIEKMQSRFLFGEGQGYTWTIRDGEVEAGDNRNYAEVPGRMYDEEATVPTAMSVMGRAMLCEVTLSKDGTEVETLREVKFK